jgi:hypothetical protein
MHYANHLEIPLKGGGVSTRLAGWPACVSGDRAYSIKQTGRMTYQAAEVTCKPCLKLLEAARKVAP